MGQIDLGKLVGEAFSEVFSVHLDCKQQRHLVSDSFLWSSLGQVKHSVIEFDNNQPTFDDQGNQTLARQQLHQDTSFQTIFSLHELVKS